MEAIIFYILLFIVALLYASVGHGGASGYLALMAIFGMQIDTMKSSALMLNLFVSLVAFVQFYKGGHFNLRSFLPFAMASIPLSFVGGFIYIDSGIYKVLLGVFLMFAVIRMLFFDHIQNSNNAPPSRLTSLVIGGSIGFLSGLLGIGGGIILSPILILLYSKNQKQAAAISAIFIFVNSLAGLGGQWTKGMNMDPKIYLYVLVAFVGGALGSYLGALKLNHQALKYVLSVVLSIAIFKLLNQ
jgi:uncharacterized membrane protein YfcA